MTSWTIMLPPTCPQMRSQNSTLGQGKTDDPHAPVHFQTPGKGRPFWVHFLGRKADTTAITGTVPVIAVVSVFGVEIWPQEWGTQMHPRGRG